ncbi:hypothetical protein D3C84_1120750 [compost metagenome]
MLIKRVWLFGLEFTLFDAVHWTGTDHTIIDRSGINLSQQVQVLVDSIPFIALLIKVNDKQLNISSANRR